MRPSADWAGAWVWAHAIRPEFQAMTHQREGCDGAAKASVHKDDYTALGRPGRPTAAW